MSAKKTATAQKPNSDEGDAPTSLDRKPKPDIKYPPYVNAYGAIPKLFEEIRKASVPPKVTQDFLENVLELKSSSHRALVPLLKKLAFIDAANVPTEAYRSYRDPSVSESIMGSQVRLAYADVFRANEYAYTLSKEALTAKLKSLTGAADDDANIPAVVGTFLELRKLASFEQTKVRQKFDQVENADGTDSARRGPIREQAGSTIGLSYTINLNLPATTEIEVFNVIFRSLREHLLDGR